GGAAVGLGHSRAASDHRVVDGEQGSRFLADIASLLRDPGRAITF
ncbi:hypothetical protein BHE97_11795, partial [Aeromicrobium sp. PE09-221]